MYEEFESQTGFLNKHACNPPDQIANVLYATGSDLLSSYSDKILGSNTDYVQNINISRYISNPRYYFQVNDDYVKAKLKVVLFPFLHQGHWMRTVEGGGGKLSFKAPGDDINAPDLYIPMMAFGTYVLLAAFFLGINGKFSPESLGVQFSTGLLCWILQVLLVEAALHTLGAGEIPLLDVVAYAGYTFVGASEIVGTKTLFGYYINKSSLLIMSVVIISSLWASLCTGVLLVKTVKRILISEVQSLGNNNYNSIKRNYVLLFMAFAQIPLMFWLGNVALAGDHTL